MVIREKADNHIKPRHKGLSEYQTKKWRLKIINMKKMVHAHTNQVRKGRSIQKADTEQTWYCQS